MASGISGESREVRERQIDKPKEKDNKIPVDQAEVQGGGLMKRLKDVQR